MWQQRPSIRCPGLFITGTDTGVGKTVAACAIAAAMRRQRPDARVAVSKPFGSGCRRTREGLVHEDAEALAHFADCRLPLDVINPIRYRAPLAPAVAAERAKRPPDFAALARSLEALSGWGDGLLVEGVGGLMVPIDPEHPTRTVLDLIRGLGLPTVVVCRSVLGTLNHTAMTVRLLKDSGCRVAGLVMNGYDTDAAATEADPSIESNRGWLERMTGTRVLCVLPKRPAAAVDVARAALDTAVITAAEAVYWWDVVKPPR